MRRQRAAWRAWLIVISPGKISWLKRHCSSLQVLLASWYWWQQPNCRPYELPLGFPKRENRGTAQPLLITCPARRTLSHAGIPSWDTREREIITLSIIRMLCGPEARSYAGPSEAAHGTHTHPHPHPHPPTHPRTDGRTHAETTKVIHGHIQTPNVTYMASATMNVNLQETSVPRCSNSRTACKPCLG